MGFGSRRAREGTVLTERDFHLRDTWVSLSLAIVLELKIKKRKNVFSFLSDSLKKSVSVKLHSESSLLWNDSFIAAKEHPSPLSASRFQRNSFMKTL